MHRMLALLPTEILHSIFSHFSFQERWRFSHVCKDWRLAMFYWRGMWAALSSHYYQLPYDLIPYQTYIKGCWIRHVYFDKLVKDEKNQAQLEKLIGFLLHQHCTTIEEVDLSVSCLKFCTFSNLAALCGNSLTRIYIALPDEINSSDSNVTPYMILQHFPNINQLYYAGPAKQQSVSPTATNFKHAYLRDLTLHLYNTTGNVEIADMLRAIPKLERLRLNLQCIEHTFKSLLSFIFSDQLSSNMTTLIFASCCDNSKLIDFGHELWTNNNKRVNSKIKCNGLKHLMLHDPSEKYYITIQQILQYIIPRSYGTLETLDLSGAYRLHGSDTMAQLSMQVFPFLERLSIVNKRYHNLMAYGNARLFKAFAENSVPHLTVLKLAGIDSDYHMELPVLATSLHCLQQVHFEDCPEILPNTLMNFFLQLGESNHNDDRTDLKRRRMTRVILRNMPGVNDDVLISILKKCCLEELVVQECDDVDINDVGRLLDAVDEKSGPKKLDLILIYYQPRFYFLARKVPTYPDPHKIQELIPILEVKGIEWRLALKDYSHNITEPVYQVFNHTRY